MADLPAQLAGWALERLAQRVSPGSRQVSASAVRPSRARLRVLRGSGTPADTDSGQRRSRTDAALEGLAHLGFRYRYQLAPAAAALGLGLEAEIGHLANSGDWWIGGAGNLGAAGLIALTRDRGEERLYAGLVGLGAGAWGGAAWALGPHTPALGVTLLVGGAIAAAPWWRHYRVRGRIRVIDGTWKPWERERWTYTRASEAELHRIYAEWPRVSADAGVPCEIVEMIADRWCYSLHVRLASGVEFETLARARGKIESALDAKRAATSIEPGELARRAVIRWTRQGAVRPDLSWPEPTAVGFFEPSVLGEYEDRTLFALDTDRKQNPHMLVAGDSGSGKTSLMAGLAVEWGYRSDTFVWLFDVAKRGAGYSHIPRAFSRTVFEPRGVVPALQALTRIAAARAEYIGREGLDQWPTSPSHPQIVVVLDETAELLGQRGALREVLTLARLGRQLGIALVIGTQRPSGEALGDSTELRSLMRLRLGLHVNEAQDSEFLFGRGSLNRGWNAHDIAIGWAIPKSPEHLAPRSVHLRFLDEKAQAERNASMPAQPELDPVSAAAEEEAQQRAVTVEHGPDAELDRPAGPPRVLSLERQDEQEEKLQALVQALRELGPTASVRALALRAFSEVNTKTWISDRGLPLLKAQGRIVGEPGDWHVVDAEAAEGGRQ
jgi:DNA segregation ATPase FtsK/SpoIIIE, S-DNA-T family